MHLNDPDFLDDLAPSSNHALIATFRGILAQDPDEALDLLYLVTTPQEANSLLDEADRHHLLLPALYTWLDGWGDRYTIDPSRTAVRRVGMMHQRIVVAEEVLDNYRNMLYAFIERLGEDAFSIHPVYRAQIEELGVVF